MTRDAKDIIGGTIAILGYLLFVGTIIVGCFSWGPLWGFGAIGFVAMMTAMLIITS
jgi:hypothetical protein